MLGAPRLHMLQALRFISIAIVFVVGTATVLSQPPKLGYDDTPMQPDGKWRIHDGTRPQPRIVKPGPPGPTAPPPADAVVLLGSGNDLSQWQADKGAPVPWPMADGVLQSGKGMIGTK